MSGPFLLILHASLGLILVVGAASLLVAGLRSDSRSQAWTSGLELVGVVAAGFNGGSYLNYHEDFSSMLMASGFALATGAYVVLLFVAAPPAAEAKGERLVHGSGRGQ